MGTGRGTTLRLCALLVACLRMAVQLEERTWLLEFLQRFQSALETSADLRGEVFLEYKGVQGDLVDPFFRYTQKNLKLMGLARHPGQPLPSLPSPAEIRKLVEGKKEVDVRDWVAEFTYWFVAKQPQQQRELFLGYGGMTHIFLPPDPKTKAPKIPFTPALRASLPIFRNSMWTPSMRPPMHLPTAF